MPMSPLYESRQTIPAEVSSRITRLRPFLILFVFISHVEHTLSPLGTRLSPDAWYMVYFIQGQICQAVLPLFFMFAGYLFMKRAELSLPFYVHTLKQKGRRLLIPLVFFNILVVLLGLLWRAPGLGIPTDYSPPALLWSFISYGGSFLPIAYPLWYLRDLFLLFLLSPVLLILYKETPLLGLVLFFVCLLLPSFSGSLIAFSYVIFPLSFYLGGLLCITGYTPPEGQKPSVWALAAFVVASALLAGAKLQHPLDDFHPVFFTLSGLNRLLGAYAFWRLASSRAFDHPLNLWASPLVFAVYLLHEPIESIVLGTFMYNVWYPTDALGTTAMFLLSPLVTVPLVFAVAGAWRRVSPRSFAFLTGS